MIYTNLTKKALIISFNAHKNQVDKSGLPYIHHPLHLAEQMDDEYSTCVALLHDVIEDTKITLEDIKNEGFPSEVVEAISYLTRDKNVDYMSYVANIKNNKIATKVKIADLNHNSDLSRLNKVLDKDLKRVEKYKLALELLQK